MKAKTSTNAVAATKFPIKTSSKFGETTVYLYNPLEHKNEVRSAVQEGRCEGDDQQQHRTDADAQLQGLRVPKEFANGEKSQFPGACNSPGKKPEEVVTETLATKLVWLDEAETEPGMLVSPAPPGHHVRVVECVKGKVKVKQYGSILAKLTPVGAVTKTLTADDQREHHDRRTGIRRLLGRRDADRSQTVQRNPRPERDRKAGGADLADLDHPGEERQGSGRLARFICSGAWKRGLTSGREQRNSSRPTLLLPRPHRWRGGLGAYAREGARR